MRKISRNHVYHYKTTTSLGQASTSMQQVCDWLQNGAPAEPQLLRDAAQLLRDAMAAPLAESPLGAACGGQWSSCMLCVMRRISVRRHSSTPSGCCCCCCCRSHR
jgi:hypothetical protein